MNQSHLIGYDVIGDVHGHLEALDRLLKELGYRNENGVYGHPERHAVFVGDLIDRGPDQVGVVRLVRAMAEARTANVVVGNHEFNAIEYATPDPEHPGEYLRRHSDKNRAQHAKFLAQVGEGSALHRKIIDWFMTIPMWCEVSLEDSRLRVVHACWHNASIDALQPVLTPDLALTPVAVVEGSRKGSPIYEAIENILKGPEVNMGGVAYRDRDGHPRRNARLQWWKTSARSLRDLALIPSGARGADNLPLPFLADDPIDTNGLIYTDDVPVLFGHYWQTGTPGVYSPTTASVDFSVANEGHLVAYRWDGERELRNEHFHSVKA